MKTQGMSWLMKTGLILLLTLASTVFMGEGWLLSSAADAAVTRVDAWPADPQINNVNTAQSTTTFAPSAGSNRIMVVTVSAHTNNTTVTTIDGTYGGSTTRALRPIVNSPDNQRRQVWMFYLNEADLAAVNGNTLTINCNNVANGRYNVYITTWGGVDQTTPITATDNLYNNNAGLTNVVTLNANAGGMALYADVHSLNEDPTNNGGFTSYTRDTVNTVYAFAADVVTAGNINPTFSFSAGTLYCGWAACSFNPYIVPDSTAPTTTGSVTVNPNVGGFTSTSPTITHTFTDAESAVSSCEYTTNGTTWVAGAVSGSGPNYTCTANPTGLTAGSKTFNMRATSAGGGPTTATATTLSVDTTVPTDGTLTATPGSGQITLSWTAATDPGGSGIVSYIVKYSAGTTAPASCSFGISVPGSPFSSATLSTTHTGLTSGNAYSYRVCATDNIGNTSGGAIAENKIPFSGPYTAIASCADCHGYKSPLTFNDSSARDGNSGTFPGSHSGHVQQNGMLCSACHLAPATESSADYKHSNGTIQIAATISGGTYGKASFATANSFSPATCSNTTCHGAASPTWGSNTTDATCSKCHGVAGTTDAQYAADSNRAAPGYLGGRATSGATAATDSKVGAHAVHLAGTSNYSSPIECAACHSNVNPGNASFTGHMNGAGSVNFSGLAVSNSATPSYTAPNCSTTYCHFGKPNNAAYTPAGAVSWTNTALLSGTPSIAECSKCHGCPPSTTGSHNGITLLSQCMNCHNHVNSDGTFNDKTLHINGIVEGGSCTGCHDTGQSGAAGTRLAITPQFGSGYSHHYQGAAAVDGKVCYACHWEADSSGSPTSYHQGTAGGTVDLVIWNATSRPTTYTDTVTATSYTSGGASASSRTELAKINNHCLGCHNDANKAIQPFLATGDTSTPVKYSWEALPTSAGGFGATAQSIASKYSDTTTTPWGKFSGNFTNAKSGQTKAFSAHGNAAANQRGWSTLAENAQSSTAVANYPNTSGTVQVLCFDCHNSHGSDTSAAVATTSYDSPTAGVKKGGILKQTTAGKGGYSVTYKPVAGGSSADKNIYNNGAALCFDCHNNSSANTTTSTGNASPWGYTATFGATQIIHGYNDNPYFGKAGGTFAKGQTYSYIGGTLTANKGGHFGASSALTTSTINNMTIGGLCTPCHDPHGVSPGIAAANRQYAVPMLKETFVTSPYKQDAAALHATSRGGSAAGTLSFAAVAGYHIDQNTLQAATAEATTGISWNFGTSANTLQTLTATQFAGLCTKCHSEASLKNTAAASSGNWKSMTRIHNSVKGWATTGGGNAGNAVHAYTCSKCHSPHNSNLPRLLVTNCLDANHKNRVASGGAANLGPFSGSNSSGNGLGRFPGGGSYAISKSRATNPGPWFFGTAGSAASPACHDSSTAGGTTFNQTSQQWNTKSLW